MGKFKIKFELKGYYETTVTANNMMEAEKIAKEKLKKIKVIDAKNFTMQSYTGQAIKERKKSSATLPVKTGKKYIDIQNEVIAKYRIKLDPNSTCWGRMHAHQKQRRICKWQQKNGIASTFDLFHEIGHIENNKGNMRRCEEEYHATVFAIDLCKEYGLEIPENIIADYQEYIYDEWDRGKRRNGNLPDKKNFELPIKAELKKKKSIL